MKKLLLLITILPLMSCGGAKQSRILKENECLRITCGEINAYYKSDVIYNGSNNDYRYLENRKVSFTYTTNKLIVKAEFDYGYNTKTHANITDIYVGNISWSLVADRG